MTRILPALILGASIAFAGDLEKHNVVWDSPSADAKGSMPIGNGDIGLNVWVEPSGDLCFFIGKTDAWDENQRLLKLGKVRVKLTPALATTNGFRQELKLRDGVIEISNLQTRISVWVDANHPVIHVAAKSVNGPPLEARASFEVWRKEKRSLGSSQSGGGNEYFSTGYTTLPAFSYPDTTLPATAQHIGWYHRNVESPWLPSLKLQKNEAIAKTEQDPILNRTMGAILRGDNFVSVSDTELKTGRPAPQISLDIHVLTQITDTPEQWLAALEMQAATIAKIPAAKRNQEHGRWWEAYWNRSWIFVHGSHSLALPVNQLPWRVGMDSGGASRFGGAITGPRVIGRALTAAEIALLAGQPPATETKLSEESGAVGCTVAAWIKPVAGETGRILDKCTAGKPDGLTFDAHPGLALRWIVGDTTMIQPNCLTAGEWQHVAATVDAGSGVRRIYRNGKLIKEERGDSNAETLTRAYTLQRFMNACGGRGPFPIKFNGSTFVVDNKFDADYRAWGGCYWFQNTRHSYWPMLMSGDFDLMKPFFDLYMKVLPARKLATRNYYGHDGAFFPETMSIWGNYADQGDLGYGVNRAGKPDGLTDNTYVRRYWQGGLEIMVMMLDYYDLTQDAAFRDQTLLPFAREVITFFDQHWQRGADGKIRFDPAQSLETWHTAKNPLPEIAGLRFVIPRLLALPAAGTDQAAWRKTLADLPPVPIRTENGKTRLMPAETFGAKANVENPELYAVFPYRLYTLAAGKDFLTIGKATYAARLHRDNFCWRQDPIQAALLGLGDEAARDVAARASAVEPGFRFPAMWAAGSDWMPDQDHVGVMMSALQRMLAQYEGDKIMLLPAWPKDWDVDFKLHAPKQTTIECELKGGKIVKLKVTPESRRNDVVINR
jgi:hypothetical protein